MYNKRRVDLIKVTKLRFAFLLNPSPETKTVQGKSDKTFLKRLPIATMIIFVSKDYSLDYSVMTWNNRLILQSTDVDNVCMSDV